jgi:hypothetical protein
MTDKPMLDIEFDKESLVSLFGSLRAMDSAASRAFTAATRRSLKAVEEAQVKSYTLTLRPARPEKSKYRRTFDLKRSSRTQMVSTKTPVVEGNWWSEGVDYARYVIGEPEQQAAIHAGRWKSLTDVRREVEPIHAENVNEELEKQLTRVWSK